jgi:hypothetical protein
MQQFTHWSMDLIGPLPKSRSGNDLIVTWVDRTSKLIVARALRQGNSSAKVLADLTFEAICCRFGLPARLTHDSDVRFCSMWKELWRLLNTKITCTSTCNQQADPAERTNLQVLEALRARSVLGYRLRSVGPVAASFMFWPKHAPVFRYQHVAV